MSDWLWDIGLFFGGFSVGILFTLGGFVLARVRREAERNGDRLVEKMGPLAARRFLEVVKDPRSDL